MRTMSGNHRSFRREKDLVHSFRQYLEPSLWTRPSENCWTATLQESACSEGRADWVWAQVHGDRPKPALLDAALVFQQPSHSRILAALRRNGARTEEFLLRRTGLSLPTLRRYLREIAEAGLIVDSGDRRFMLSERFELPYMEICSFEFKLANWKRALYQATRYRTFSHRAFVVLPSDSLAPALRCAGTFRRLNVGLISHDPKTGPRAVIRSRKRNPPSRHRLIMAWGMLLARGELYSRHAAKQTNGR